MIKKSDNIKFSADAWLMENMEPLVNKFAGRYVVIVDNEGIIFTDKDGSPRK